MATALLTAMQLVLALTWQEPAGRILEAHRAAFFGGPGADGAFERLRAANADLLAAAPTADELRAALAASDARQNALAIAAMTMVKQPDPVLLDALLERLATEEERGLRLLLVAAVVRNAGGAWIDARAGEVVRALANEQDTNVVTFIAMDLLPLLPREHLLGLAAALAVRAEETVRAVVLAAVRIREGDVGLTALAEQLRRRERPDLAREAEAARVADPARSHR